MHNASIDSCLQGYCIANQSFWQSKNSPLSQPQKVAVCMKQCWRLHLHLLGIQWRMAIYFFTSCPSYRQCTTVVLISQLSSPGVQVEHEFRATAVGTVYCRRLSTWRVPVVGNTEAKLNRCTEIDGLSFRVIGRTPTRVNTNVEVRHLTLSWTAAGDVVAMAIAVSSVHHLLHWYTMTSKTQMKTLSSMTVFQQLITNSLSAPVRNGAAFVEITQVRDAHSAIYDSMWSCSRDALLGRSPPRRQGLCQTHDVT